MNDYAKGKLKNAVEILDTNIGAIQFQALNNLDELISVDGKVDPMQVDRMVKKPLMRAVTKLRLARGLLLKAQSEGKLPDSKEIEPCQI